MAYDARAVANYFFDLAKEKGQQLTPLKVQKLIYFAHGWHLALKDAPLVVDPIEAWQYGPVISSVYHGLKHFGSGVITSHLSDFDLNAFDFKTPKIPQEDKEVRTILDAVWDSFGNSSALQLSNLSHVDGGPWAKAREGKDADKNVVIDDVLIKNYFVEKAQKSSTKVA